MAEIAAPKKKSRSRTSGQSVAAKELAAMKTAMRDITSSKAKAKAFLTKSGLIEKDGKLAKQYR